MGPRNRLYVVACIAVLCAIGVGSLIFASFAFKTYYIPSGTMEPTILVGDRIVVRRITNEDFEPRRGQIVTFVESHEGGEISKIYRVLGLPGESIEIIDKKVHIDGQELTDPWGVHRDDRTFPNRRYIDPQIRARDNLGPIVVPQGAVFVMGDNRDFSHDSRFTGPVELSNLTGTPLYVYWSIGGSGIFDIRFGRIGHSLRDTVVAAD